MLKRKCKWSSRLPFEYICSIFRLSSWRNLNMSCIISLVFFVKWISLLYGLTEGKKTWHNFIEIFNITCSFQNDPKRVVWTWTQAYKFWGCSQINSRKQCLPNATTESFYAHWKRRFFSVNKHFISRQAPTAGGICNSVNVSGSQGETGDWSLRPGGWQPSDKIFNNS